MAVKKKTSGKASALPLGIAIGATVAMGITVLGAVILTALIVGEQMSLETYGYAVMPILFLAAMLGAVVAMLKIKHQKMQVSLLTGLTYYLLLLSLNALFFGGQYKGMLVTGLLILAGTGIAAVLGSRGGKPLKRRMKIAGYR